MRGDIAVAYVSMQYHKVHCAYSFRKLLRAVLGVVKSDNYMVRLGHTEYCEMFMMADDGQAAKGVTKFLDCFET